jgi:RNA polymerase sigma-70 factor (ECF subfamily)
VLQNSTLAEEATQDTFVKIWRQHTQWDASKGNLKNWLLAIAHHTAIDRLRQERRQPSLHPEALEEFEGKSALFPAKPHEAGWQDGVVLRTLLAQLTKDHAELIELAFFEGLTHADIAARLRLPLGTVKTRIRTGLQQLRNLWLQSAL